MNLSTTPASRATDPLPSHQAEQEINESDLRGRQQRLVRALVRRYPGRTSRELAQIMGIDRYMDARQLELLSGAVEEIEQGVAITLRT